MKTTSKPRAFASIERPYVDRQGVRDARRLEQHVDEHELNLIDGDTGCVVYTTPIAFRMFGGQLMHPGNTARVACEGAARCRAIAWAKSHGFTWNATHGGQLTRASC